MVTDASGRPLAGALTRIVDGEGRALVEAVAGALGEYALRGAPPGRRLVRASAVGHRSAERLVAVPTAGTATADFELAPSAIALDEIVVTGLGERTRRRALGVAVDVVSGAELELAPVRSLDQALQGRVAGATVRSVSAQPGTGSLINFRGTSSAYSAQTPVVYVDGVRVDNAHATAYGTGGEQSSALADLSVDDVERVEITRGGAASTLFGSDAAAGVIQVFTGKGSPGPPRIALRVEQGVEAPELWNVMDAGLIFPERVAAGEAPASFLRDEYFRLGRTQSVHLSASGGSATATFSVGGRIEDRSGTQPKNGSVRYTLRGGLRAHPRKGLTVEFSGSYARHNFGRLYNGASIADPLTAFEVGDALFFSRTSSLRDALDLFLLPDIREWVNRFVLSTSLRWRVRDAWTVRLQGGTDHRTNQQRVRDPVGFAPTDPAGRINRRDRSFASVSLDGGVTYGRESRDGRWTTRTTLGAQGFRQDVSVVNGQGAGLGLPASQLFGSAARVTAYEGNAQVFTGGAYLDQRLSAGDKVHLGVGLRLDAASSFGDDVALAPYPKATGAYVASDDWAIPLVDELKVRAAWGRTGRFPGAFLGDRTFSATPFRGESAPRFANAGNDDLGPETTSTFEVGVDAALAGDRIALGGTLYRAVTADALLPVPRQPVTGLGSQLANAGEILNQGVELEVRARLLDGPRLEWSVGATFQYNHNQVVDLGGATDFSLDGVQKRVSDCWGVTEANDLATCRGGPVGAWWTTTPVDTNGDGLPDGSELNFTGGFPTPDKSGALRASVTLGSRFEIRALADWAGGHEVFDWGSVWAASNGIHRRERLRCGAGDARAQACPWAFPIQYNLDGTVRGPYSQGAARTAFLYDGDYFKLREATARFEAPASWAARTGARRVTVYAAGRNLWIWSRNRLVDGELAGIVRGGVGLGSESSVTLSPNRALHVGVEWVF